MAGCQRRHRRVGSRISGYHLYPGTNAHTQPNSHGLRTLTNDRLRSQGLWLQDTHCADGASQFDSTNSRAYVALGTKRGRESCVENDPEKSVIIFYRDKICRNGRNEYEEFSPHKPTTVCVNSLLIPFLRPDLTHTNPNPITQWQPKCLVMLIEPDSMAALRDELVEQGRILIDKVRVDVNYTTATSENPDLTVSSLNCALGREMLKLYEHDQAGQEERDLLVSLQQQLASARVQFELYEKIYLG